ncbi:MAG: hypothetical protein ACRDPC_25360 [Solirubrobacteraceae bacterium]
MSSRLVSPELLGAGDLIRPWHLVPMRRRLMAPEPVARGAVRI